MCIDLHRRRSYDRATHPDGETLDDLAGCIVVVADGLVRIRRSDY